MILTENLPFSDDAILDYVVLFLQTAHAADEPYTVRDGVNIARYALKLLADGQLEQEHALRNSVEHILGEDALRHLPG